MSEPIQIKLIHIAKTQLGLSEDEYRQTIGAQTHGKKWSSKDLTYFEADGLISYFKTLGFKIRSNCIQSSGHARRKRWAYANAARRERNHNVVVLASRNQMQMIDALVSKVPWRYDDGYQRWLSRYMRIERIVTADHASKVIEGLKGLLMHQQGA